MNRIAAIALAAAVLVLGACQEDPLDIGNRSLTGEWRGAAQIVIALDTARYAFVLDLEQDERDVSGTGVVTSGDESLEVDVDGEWQYPDVELRFSAPEYATLVFTGRFGASPDSVGGTLNGSGFNNTPFFIRRQP